jgi:hypothetical protein
LLIFEVTEGRILPLPNQKSKINNRKSPIHGRSAAEKTNRVAVHRAKIRRVELLEGSARRFLAEARALHLGPEELEPLLRKLYQPEP